jgi:hypothetical protein
MNLVPITLDEAKAFVGRNHRHNKPPVSWKFGVGLEHQGEMIGVAVAGRPVARPLDTRFNIEVTRVCTLDCRNANSRLYGAILRAAADLGYRKAYTYTLASESGASLKAAGWEVDAELAPRQSWNCNARSRVQVDMFGTEQRLAEAKIRWVRTLCRHVASCRQT